MILPQAMAERRAHERIEKHLQRGVVTAPVCNRLYDGTRPGEPTKGVGIAWPIAK